jgi:signal peptidase I
MTSENDGNSEALAPANDHLGDVAPEAAAQPALSTDPAGEVAAAETPTAARAVFAGADPLRPAAPKPAPAAAPSAAKRPPEPAGPAEDDFGGADEKPKDDWLDIIKTVAAALAFALVLRTVLFQPFTIPSASMEPNLYEGDYLVVSKWNYGISRYSMPFSGLWPIQGRLFDQQAHRGDIVVFKLPSDNKTDYIKRVIGLPGDQIQMRDGLLYINNEPVKDVKTGQLTTLYPGKEGTSHDADVVRETLPGGKTFTRQDIIPNAYDAADVLRLDNTPVFTVPPHNYFMMGDNRHNSDDSRADVGMVPEENLEGKAQMVLFSWHPGASLWKPWTWFTKVRFSRFFKPLV